MQGLSIRTEQRVLPLAQGPRRLRWLALLLAFVGVRPASAASEIVEGFTEPVRTIDVAASELGIVTRVEVEDGDSVAQGDLLAELDSEVLQRTWEIARAKADAVGAADAARAERDLKLKRLTQLERLMSRGHATPGELARARADLAVAEARVKMAEEEQQMSELECRRIMAQIERRRIRSPIHGVVSEVHRDIGEAFLTNDPRIVTLVQLDQLRVRFPVMPHQAVHISEGQQVELQMPDIGKQTQGTVERISPVMDAKSGTITVEVLIDNKERKLRSGTRCQIELEVATPASPVTPYRTRSVTRDR